MSTTEEAAGAYDRLSELKAFDDTKAGVKGLVDAGVTTVPAIFRHHHHQGQLLSSGISSGSGGDAISIPVIDLSASSSSSSSLSDARARAELVAQVKAAAETAGLFHLVNHGVLDELMSEMLASVRRFHEAPPESKRPYYTRDPGRRLRFNSNFDLFSSPAANWRDTLFCAAAPDPPPAEELPPAVRHVMFEYGRAARAVAARVLGLLSEALGLDAGRLAGMGCAEGLSLVCNYYPPCPEPERALGTGPHCDPSALTLLLQDGAVDGLQVLVDGEWRPVRPRPGALVVNIGDTFMALSNGRYRSCIHRAVVHRERERRSLAFFLCPRDDRVVRPPPRLLAGRDQEQQHQQPRRYPDFTWADLARFTQLHYRADARTLDAFARWLGGAPPTSSCAVATSASQSQDKAQETA